MSGGAAAQSQVFNANRAIGRISLAVASDHGRTRRVRVHEEGSLRVRFPNTDPGECEAVIVNTAGGIAGGDRFDLDVEVGPQAQLSVSGAAAEKIYRTHGPDAEISVRLDVKAGGALRWLPQETILYDRTRVSRTIDVDLAEGASIVLAEAIVFGRSAMGEAVHDGKMSDRWRVRKDGRLVFAETLNLDGAIAQKLSEKAVADGGVAIATLLVIPGDDTVTSLVRALEDTFAGEFGISAWNGIAVARFCARDGASLRRDLVLVLNALNLGALPRLWSN
ncbi:MAG TPA: urease accessory protein UreD [Pseudorhodoplanes sp.]|nr:urease accessory protein UreD [Pseudorhodoplanes sp.]